MPSIKSLCGIDVKYNMTPDLAALRFIGGRGIPVFLWDNVQDLGGLEEVLFGMDVAESHTVSFYNALTVKKFLPWYNIVDNTSSSTFQGYCLHDHDEADLIDLDEYSYATPRRLQGKLAYFNLEALKELDMFYSNNYVFTRKMIRVTPSAYSNTEHICFTYMNDIDGIATYDEDEGEYRLDRGIDVAPLGTSETSKESVYKF